MIHTHVVLYQLTECEECGKRQEVGTVYSSKQSSQSTRDYTPEDVYLSEYRERNRKERLHVHPHKDGCTKSGDIVSLEQYDIEGLIDGLKITECSECKERSVLGREFDLGSGNRYFCLNIEELKSLQERIRKDFLKKSNKAEESMYSEQLYMEYSRLITSLETKNG